MTTGKTMQCSYVMDLPVLRTTPLYHPRRLTASHTGNRIERCLSYDEKPLLLFQKLKDAKKNPVFMLKHIKDIRSPIAVAQQKHALRKASISSEHGSSNGGTPNVTPSHPNKPIAAGQGKAIARPPRLEVSDLSAPAPPLTGTTPQAGWPEVMSPVVENKPGEDSRNSREITSTPLVNLAQSSSDFTKPRATTSYGSTEAESTKREMPPSMGVSYAVAIYPYMAEQEDEFDVVVCVYTFPFVMSYVVSPWRQVGTPLSFSLEPVAGGLCNGTQRAPVLSIPIPRNKDGYLQVVCWRQMSPSHQR